jgi:hypothetical protein
LYADTLGAVRRDPESIATKPLNVNLERLDILCASPAHAALLVHALFLVNTTPMAIEDHTDSPRLH